MTFSEDDFLGGRVKLRQPVEGYRAGLDAVLLAAAVMAEAGERVLDLGAGAGAASLCLLARLPQLEATLVESDPDMAELARANGLLNHVSERMTVIVEDIARRGALSGTTFDHVIANPPFHDGKRHRPPRLEQRALALIEGETRLEQWFAVALKRLKPGGSLTFILRADRLAEALAALDGAAGDIRILPVQSRAAEPAIRILVQGIKGRRTPLSLLPALVLFADSGQQSERASAILRDGHPLPLS